MAERNRWAGWAVVLCVLVIGPGCARKTTPPAPAAPALDYARELPPGAVALLKIPPDKHPDFSAGAGAANLDAVVGAIGNSLAYLGRPGSRATYPYLDITHGRAVATLEALRDALNDPAVRADPALLNRTIAERFDIYASIGAPRTDGAGYTGRVLFTGYFTPTYEASLTRGGPFQWPLYRRPADLVTSAAGETLGRRAPDGTVVPYFTRAEIEGGKLAGNEIVWLKDRWEAYVVTVQGSARLRLRDGRILELGYAGHNGHEYQSPAMKMVADGVISKEHVGAATLRDYFARNPAAMDRYLWHNPRTVFFAERPGGPFGSLNIPVTPMATLATDKKVYPPALPAFVDAGPWKQFMLDQDAGGAIRAAGRGDLYMGVGEEAGRLAGEQLGEGRLYYLVAKEYLETKNDQ